MPTPVAHTLGGLLLLKLNSPHRPGWRELLFSIFFANAADLDFILGFFFNSPNRFHHGISHSVGMGVAAGFSVSLLMLGMKKGGALYTGFAATAFYLTHVSLDYFSLDSSWPYGLPCLWPVTDQYFISPVSLFTDVHRGGTNAGFLPGLFSLHNFYAIFREIIVVSLLYMGFKKLGDALGYGKP